jgi:hypothetical protein
MDPAAPWSSQDLLFLQESPLPPVSGGKLTREAAMAARSLRAGDGNSLPRHCRALALIRKGQPTQGCPL